jgi:hypothetical protein
MRAYEKYIASPILKYFTSYLYGESIPCPYRNSGHERSHRNNRRRSVISLASVKSQEQPPFVLPHAMNVGVFLVRRTYVSFPVMPASRRW